MKNSTLCYIEKGDKYLVLHRTKKENDPNRDKWIGVGGKLEEGESPEECLLREVREETGLTLLSYSYRGVVTFASDKWEAEIMHLFTASLWTGELTDCDEGELEWREKCFVRDNCGWEGDRLFLELLEDGSPFFSLKLVYEGERLKSALLNGSPIGKPSLLVSACLLGAYCKYNGGNNYNEAVCCLAEKYELIPICPETEGGLDRPREPAEICGSRVLDRQGRELTESFERGASAALDRAKRHKCRAAVLKQSSPSCGTKMIYDGSFTGKRICGMGITARLLAQNGIALYGEEDASSLY